MLDWVLTMFGAFFFAWRRVRQKCIHLFLQRYFTQRIKSVGEGVRFNGICRITGCENIEIEPNVHIGDNAFIRGEGGLFIGENTHFSRNLVIYTHNHDYEGQALPYDHHFRLRPVRIERNVWIGMDVIVLPGAVIGEGAIVGAGSVVSGKIEPFAIVGAVPPDVLKYRNRAHYQKLDSQKKYGGKNGRLLSEE